MRAPLSYSSTSLFLPRRSIVPPWTGRRDDVRVWLCFLVEVFIFVTFCFVFCLTAGMAWLRCLCFFCRWWFSRVRGVVAVLGDVRLRFTLACTFVSGVSMLPPTSLLLPSVTLSILSLVRPPPRVSASRTTSVPVPRGISPGSGGSGSIPRISR